MFNDSRNSHDFYEHRAMVADRIKRAIENEKRRKPRRKSKVDTPYVGSWAWSEAQKKNSL